MGAADYDGAAGRQVFAPVVHIRGRTIDRTDDQLVVRAKGVRTADLEQQWRRRRAEAAIKIVGRNREGLSVHGAISSNTECCAALGRRAG